MIKIHPSWFVFLTIIITGILILASTDNWLIAWIGFELTLLGFLPIFTINSYLIEGIVKYFLVQAGGSALFLLSFLVMTSKVSNTIIIISIAIKLGIFPFFQWVPLVIASLTWEGCAVLATLQKIGPLFMLLNINVGGTQNIILIFLSVARVLVRGILGFNQRFLRRLIGYSSISHTGWLVTSSLVEFKMCIIYIAIYFSLTIILFISFKRRNINTVVQPNVPTKNSIANNLIIITIVGIPPFSIFIIKALILNALIIRLTVTYILILGASLSAFYYIRFVIPRITSYWNRRIAPSNKLIIATVVATIIIPVLMVIY